MQWLGSARAGSRLPLVMPGVRQLLAGLPFAGGDAALSELRRAQELVVTDWLRRTDA